MPTIGRPTDYSPELVARICELVATNTKGLIRLCAENDDIPSHTTIKLWRYKYPAFAAQYAQAKIFQTELLAEEIIEISDDGHNDTYIDEDGHVIVNGDVVARSRLRVDSRKWLASKLIPRTYGDLAKQADDKKDSLIEQLIAKI